MHSDVIRFCINVDASMRDVVARMDANRLGIVLLVNEDTRLEGTITDGDVRRFMLDNGELDEPARQVLERKQQTRYARPITAQAGSDPQVFRGLLREHKILHLPVVDADQRVVGLVTQDEFFDSETPPMQAIVMAGGFGTRLHPLTHDTPKAMLPLGDRPLLEIIIEQLKKAGVGRVHLATHHQEEQISGHFGDGADFGVDISYVGEDRPLGTAGALGRIDRIEETLLVINGDILTDIDFRSMLAFHREYAADLTVAVKQYDLKLPYGVVDCDGPKVRSLQEKPLWKYFVNAGIYLVEPSVRDRIPTDSRFDMTELIQALLEADRPVASFPIREYWLDIGQHDDYKEAQLRMNERKLIP